MVIGADGHIQVDQPLLVQLLQQLPVQVCNLAGSWLATILASFQLLWAQSPELLLTYTPKVHYQKLCDSDILQVKSIHSWMMAAGTGVASCG